MVYAMLYLENANIVDVYESRDAALADLLAAVTCEPELRDALGLRPLEHGRPAGRFQSASELLADQLDQQQLDIGPTHGP
jgi:hypothetical protein